ncbi:hypothetical protein LIER_40646 [Lithospermum erythrorhizon]|uniref:Reverse transcriptase domain-containing protein n=1 Tax=Lithospermum erythrorhizon TaxID=34254 RepID=A0AAV3QXR0_LITER
MLLTLLAHSFLHVILLDDFLVLCSATTRAVSDVKEVLKVFGEVSGLHPNLNKSTCFFACVEDERMKMLSSMLEISVGCLPVRYLGIPLTTKQLRAQDCRVFIEKIRGKIEGRGNKFLSFAGWLKGQCIWGSQSRSTYSWVWCKLVKLSNHIRPYVRIEIGDKKRTNYLFDKWLDDGCLADFLTTREISALNIKKMNLLLQLQ